MGWFRDDPAAHEGHLVGLVVEARTGRATHLRELSYHQDHDRKVPTDGLRVAAFQVACGCGWRSSAFIAPVQARWRPYSLDLGDEALEDAACRLWGEHYDSAQQMSHARLTLYRP
jgi:hypothetical protein